ncbi:hypothetical protein M2263_000533 [Providencia alcalifaciens]|nr:hypothetical protein [Providencia alcalifaciens]
MQMLVKDGINSISLEIAPLSWFDINQIEKDKSKFNKKASCSINVFQRDNLTGEELSIAKMRIAIGDDGIPQAYFKNEIDSSVVKEGIIGTNTEKVNANKIRNVVGEFEYPKDIQLTKFTKKITLSDVPDWVWINSSDYEKEKLPSLKIAYQELWNAFDNKDITAIRRINKTANEAWALSTGSTESKIFDSYNIIDRVNNPSSKMISIDWDNFIPLVMNNGKMVKLVYKEDFSYSPITMTYLNSRGKKALYSFSPIFSFVDGKFIPVI